MSLERIKNTAIWKKTLEDNANDTPTDKANKEQLRNAFKKLKSNIEPLVSRIAAEFPGLTVHDTTHLDALWEVADVIIGNEFELTPLEGFVLGSVFLLHDAALSFEAYEGGKARLRETKQWKDSYVSWKESLIDATESDWEEQADFNAIRCLHASQAAKLLGKAWENGLYLLEDRQLRIHLGGLIGDIASSHHWHIEDIESRFNAQFNVLPGFPNEWRINPIKLACILRCADAAHIDCERAPDFLLALLKRKGISHNHWKAQNRIAQVDIDQAASKKDSLIFNSTNEFTEADFDAWYIIYDAICLIEKELYACNLVLEKYNDNKAFQAKKVTGAESPESLSPYIRTQGWQPCSAKLHAGNIETLVEKLGGINLYGVHSDHLCIALRELIQNARDAIKARVFFENNPEFEGKITISILQNQTGQWIRIDDNGIGMSERVLKDSLLEFGTSFWCSSLIQDEFPGLKSSGFRSIGKFGIGFYSVFMIAQSVIVTSKKYDQGLPDTWQLKFPKGLSLRPIFSKGPADDFVSTLSTSVKLKLKPEMLHDNLQITIKNQKMGSSDFDVPLKSYLAAICSGLDVAVYYKENDTTEKIHTPYGSGDFDSVQWLKTLSFCDYQQNKDAIVKYIDNNYSRVKPIKEGSGVLGFAAINTYYSGQNDYLSIATIGGLASSVHNRDGEKYIGFIDYEPESAKRDIIGQRYTSNNAVKQWAEEQLQSLLALDLEPREKYTASSALSHFGVDPSELVQILLSYAGKIRFYPLEEVAKLATQTEIAFLAVPDLGGNHIDTHNNYNQINLPDKALVLPLFNSSFLSLKFDGDEPENNNSILDCLWRQIKKMLKTPRIQRVDLQTTVNMLGLRIEALTLIAE